MILTEQQQKDLEEVRRLLDEAYEHYFEHSGGHCKSAEGHITLEFNNYFNRRDGMPFELRYVGIYSYVLGPSRQHYFDTTALALQAVQKWHGEEMSTGYDEDGAAL